jgi:hypothetical protein
MLIQPILDLPNRKNIITKHGIIQDLHRTAIEWYKSENDSVFMREFVIYIVNNYATFKTKK